MPTPIAELIAAKRKRLGLTQTELAERMGMPVVTLRSYEQGKRSQMSFNFAIQLAKALGIKLDRLARCERMASACRTHDGRHAE